MPPMGGFAEAESSRRHYGDSAGQALALELHRFADRCYRVTWPDTGEKDAMRYWSLGGSGRSFRQPSIPSMACIASETDHILI